MRLSEAAVPGFARHETFHPRYGWFRKAYEAVLDDPHAFTNDDATVELGVGKNMVKSIRFWGMAAELIDEEGQGNPRSSGLVPTEFAQMLFGNDNHQGWDPYIEDPGTLWLLHWNLLAPPCRLPVWWAAFNEFHAVEFDSDELELACMGMIDAVASWPTPRPSSVRKDLTALLRTYAPAEQSRRGSIDDALDCPLRELGLITRSAATNKYRFNIGAKPTLPSAVVAYAVLNFVARAEPGANTVLLSRMATEPGSPGRAFRLTETDLAAALQPAVAENSDCLTLASPAGAAQLAWDGNPTELSRQVLDRYFGVAASRSLDLVQLPLSAESRALAGAGTS